MTDFADDSSISVNNFDDHNPLNGNGKSIGDNGNRSVLTSRYSPKLINVCLGANDYHDNELTNDSRTDDESDSRADGNVPSKANDDEDRYRFANMT